LFCLRGFQFLTGEIAERQTENNGRADEKAAEEMQIYLRIFDLMTDSIFVHDFAGRFLFFNQAAYKLRGYTPDELRKMTVRELDSPEYSQALEQGIKVLREKGSGTFESVHRRRDGSEMPVEIHARIITLNGQKVILSVISDITERKKTEEALIKSEENYRHLLEFAPTAIFEVDYKTPRFIRVNDATCRLMGYTREELLSTNPFSLLEPESAELFNDRIRRVLIKQKNSDNVELKVITKDQRHLWVSLHVKPNYKGGKVDTALVFGYDVTERKKTQEALFYQANLLSQVHDAVLAFDANFNIAYYNKSAEELSGWKAEEVLGKSGIEFLQSRVEGVSLEASVADLLATGHWEGEVNYKRKDGSFIICEFESKTLSSADNEFLGIVASVRDITERVKLQQKLEDHAKNLEKIVEERTDQLKDAERLATIGATAGMVGHDIRNPLQAIFSDTFLLRLNMDTLSESKVKDDVIESLDSIDKNVIYINKIVQDLQDYARPIVPVHKEVDFQSVIQDTLVKKAIPENVDATFVIGEDADKMVTDPFLLKRILANLVNNAVQAMPNGGKLIIRTCKKASNILLTVEDTGAGIPDDIQSKLFTPLFTTKSKGQGFGLAVVKRMTEALGGTVSFESEKDKGTKFIIKLPIKP
jgi:PAS domain S-box-containing protein